MILKMDKYKIKNYLSAGAKRILLSIAVIFAFRYVLNACSIASPLLLA